MRSWKTLATLVVLAAASVGFADAVLYDFESGGQGWGSYGLPTTDSGVLPEGSVGQGHYHAFDAGLGGWGIIDVSPATNLTGFVGLSVDSRLVDIPGYPSYNGPRNVDIGIEIAGNEYYAAAVALPTAYQTLAVNFADFVPGGSDLSGAIIKFRILTGGSAGVGRFDYDQVTGIVPEPASLVLLGLLAALRRR